MAQHDMVEQQQDQLPVGCSQCGYSQSGAALYSLTPVPVPAPSTSHQPAPPLSPAALHCTTPGRHGGAQLQILELETGGAEQYAVRVQAPVGTWRRLLQRE